MTKHDAIKAYFEPKVSELAASWKANDDAQQAVLNFFRGNAG